MLAKIIILSTILITVSEMVYAKKGMRARKVAPKKNQSLTIRHSLDRIQHQIKPKIQSTTQAHSMRKAASEGRNYYAPKYKHERMRALKRKKIMSKWR